MLCEEGLGVSWGVVLPVGDCFTVGNEGMSTKDWCWSNLLSRYLHETSVDILK